MVSGIPGASLSATSGTAPASLTLNINTAGLNTGVYAGVVAIYAPTATSGFFGVPVVLTVLDPPPCVYTLIPTGGTIPAVGGNGSFAVSTGSLCSWTATTADSFVTIAPGTASGTGSGTVQFSVSANAGLSCAAPATITAGGKSFAITQFGSTCALAITPLCHQRELFRVGSLR